jgi:hypothetical protein
MGLLALLASMSMGVFMSLPGRLAHQAAASTVRALLRRARAAAIESRAEAEVSFASGHVEARAWTPVALLRFEDLPEGPHPGPEVTMGARGLAARAMHVTVDKGRVGNAVFFEAPGGDVDCGDLPAFAAQAGVRIEAWVCPADFDKVRNPPEETSRGPRPPAPGARKDDPYLFQVAGKGDAYFLRVREDYALVGGVRGAKAKEGTVVRETAPGLLSAERWAEVALVYDGEDLALLVNGLRRDIPPGKNDPPLPRALAADRAPLVVSSPDPALTFVGGIDEVRVSAILAEEGVDFGADIAIDAPPVVRFDPRGELDRVEHASAVRITVRRAGMEAATASATAELITVERSGALR